MQFLGSGASYSAPPSPKPANSEFLGKNRVSASKGEAFRIGGEGGMKGSLDALDREKMEQYTKIELRYAELAANT